MPLNSCWTIRVQITFLVELEYKKKEVGQRMHDKHKNKEENNFFIGENIPGKLTIISFDNTEDIVGYKDSKEIP